MKETEPSFVAGVGLGVYREQLGMKIAPLAKASGVSPGQISMAENGQRGLSVTALVRLSAAMRVEPQWLLELPLELEFVRDLDYGPDSAVRDSNGYRPTWLQHINRHASTRIDKEERRIDRLELVNPDLHPLRVIDRLVRTLG